MTRAASTLVVAILLIELAPSSLAAQDFRGTIQGRVTDPQGAAIPHVTVLVTNEETGVASEALTESDGAYAAPFLLPGRYRVEAALPGFKKVVQSGITVGVGQRAPVDLTLALGEVSETVDVRAEASLLDRASGGLGQTIDVKRVEDMPLNGRMIFMLNRLAAGVNWQVPTFGATGTSGLRPFDNGGGSAWSMNGGQVSTNEFLLDGAPNSTRGRYNFGPPVDAVEEFRIQTNTYDAQYGRTGGGVVNMTLKSGTNTFRGQAWNFLKSDRLNSNDVLNRSQGQPKPPYQANQYGITVRGPIARSRTFYMGTFEGLRERVPFPQIASVPTEAERRGDFSRSYTDQVTPLVIYDPLTTTCNAAGQCTRTPFPNNVIPADRINPIASRLLSLYPLPTLPGQRLNNFVNSVNKARYDYDSELARIDHNFSEASKMFVSIHHNRRDEFRSTNGFQGTVANQGQWPQTRINRGGTADWVRLIGTRTMLNLRGGYTWFTEDAEQRQAKELDRATLGFQNLPGTYLPRIGLDQYNAPGSTTTSIGVGSDGRGTSDQTASVQGNVTRDFARQRIKAGGEHRLIRATPKTSGDYNGYFNFTRGYTQRDPNAGDNSSGNSVASFLLGYPASGMFGGGNERNETWHYTALYAQDDFRMSPRLTLNLGLRWDYESGVVDAEDRLIRGFAFDRASPLAAQVRTTPGAAECPACSNLAGGLLFAGVDGVPRALFDRDRNNFQPRAGLAYSLNDKTVLRGGYGLYYAFRGQLGSQTGFFVTTPYIAGDINGRVGVPELGVNRFSNPFPNGALEPPGASQGLLTQVGRGISFDDPTFTLPHIHQYNATVSREITRNLMVEASYVGSRTRGLATMTLTTDGKNINAISAEDLAKGAAYLQAQVPNPFAGLLPGTSRNGTTIQRQELLRPYPQFGDITRNAFGVGRSWYNSFQFIVQKRVSRGLTFTSSYTFSRTMEQDEFLNAQDTEPLAMIADQDRPHIWQFNGVYELPFGRGQPIGREMGSALNRLVGGWQFNWNFNWQSGRPLGMPGSLEPIPGTSAKLPDPTADRWFNTCYVDLSGALQKCQPGESPAWRQRPPFTLRTTPLRFDGIRVPWKPALDASLFKHVEVSRRVRLEIRLEAFNLTNTVIFASPNTTFNDANFGRIAEPRGSVYFPRNIQLGFKLSF
jgi:Carboxypeptidase regulatory-like domain/TonB dependent receptor